MKETRKVVGKLQHKELEALKQRLEPMKLQGQEKDEEQEKLLKELKTLKKIEGVKAMLEQNKKMDETQQCMEHLQGEEETGKEYLR